jgi:hypothetical protein
MRTLAIAALALCSLLPVAPQDEHDETPLAEAMEVVETAVGKLRRTLRDPAKNAESLALLVEADTAALACKGHTPSLTASLPEAEREAFVSAYRKQMAELLRGLLEVEIALLDGDGEAAKTALQLVREMEEPAHERFTDDG